MSCHPGTVTGGHKSSHDKMSLNTMPLLPRRGADHLTRRMEGWMEGRKEGRKDGRMDGWMDEWKDEWMYGWMDGRKEGRKEDLCKPNKITLE